VLRCEDREKELSGFEPQTTNNRMELTAALVGLSILKEPCRVTLTSDSQYLSKGITEWMPKWKKNGWRSANKKPVKNRDLWQALDTLCSSHQITWKWVKGHAGHAENERCDILANQAVDLAVIGNND